ncbi:hypothetical protein VNO77_11149 [Canavalia gladiata]|uniref:Uncharacterized protein n=1 Tax=Canavalia gladiata TaxID=3824 RepID=A0AAN9QXJ1_CANGL
MNKYQVCEGKKQNRKVSKSGRKVRTATTLALNRMMNKPLKFYGDQVEFESFSQREGFLAIKKPLIVSLVPTPLVTRGSDLSPYSLKPLRGTRDVIRLSTCLAI